MEIRVECRNVFPILGGFTPILGIFPPILGKSKPILGRFLPFWVDLPYTCFLDVSARQPILGNHNPILG